VSLYFRAVVPTVALAVCPQIGVAREAQLDSVKTVLASAQLAFEDYDLVKSRKAALRGKPAFRSNAPRLPRPIRLAQFAFEDLPRVFPRHLRVEGDGLRYFVGGKTGLQKRLDIVGIQ
jgi:hypothetical protein